MPNWTLPRAEVSPSNFEWPRSRARMCIGTGRDSVPGTAALLCGAGPPESACVLGAARLWPVGQEPRLLPMAKPGRDGDAFTTAAVTPEPPQQSVTVPGKGNYCLLTSRALCGFGSGQRPAAHNGVGLFTPRASPGAAASGAREMPRFWVCRRGTRLGAWGHPTPPRHRVMGRRGFHNTASPATPYPIRTSDSRNRRRRASEAPAR